MSWEEDVLPPEDEEPPESLRKKWDREDFQDERGERNMMACPHCGQMIDRKSFSCLYCCERVFTKSGLIGWFANAAPTTTAILVFCFILISLLVYRVAF